MADSWYFSSQKSRRCYHRVISGIERGGQLRFLTLTSSNDSPDTCQRSFRALYMRLKRRGLIQGYIKVPEKSRNGKQHLHVLFRGSYLEQALISRWWQDIHRAKIVDVRAVGRKRGKKVLASYMAKYMSKENLFRYSWSWGWVWKGFCRDWRNLKKYASLRRGAGIVIPFERVLSIWHGCLKRGSPDFINLMAPMAP
ncbi:hypothetical protein ES705_30417 [subsurface metagenome]